MCNPPTKLPQNEACCLFWGGVGRDGSKDILTLWQTWGGEGLKLALLCLGVQNRQVQRIGIDLGFLWKPHSNAGPEFYILLLLWVGVWMMQNARAFLRVNG